jgi:polysaccharide export outer membrane protein
MTRASKLFGALMASALLLSALLSCSGVPTQAPVASLEPSTDHDASADYRIGAEDVLEVLVWRNEALSKVVTVRPDGKISLPLIGEVEAAGLTPIDLRDQITEKVKEYYKEVPQVSVIVQRANNSSIHIIGEVRQPGSQTLRNGTTLLQAIAFAGGLTPFASKNNILVIRGNSADTTTFKVRYKDIISGNKPDQNIILKPGDIIMIN